MVLGRGSAALYQRITVVNIDLNTCGIIRAELGLFSNMSSQMGGQDAKYP